MKVITYTSSARRSLNKIPAQIRARITAKLLEYASTGGGDVKALAGRAGARMRIGDYRAIFIEASDSIEVVAVGHRREIYRWQEPCMSKPQFIRTEGGEELVVLTRRDYMALRARAGEEDAEDNMTAVLVDESVAAQNRGEEIALPEEVWAAIEAGQSAIKVVRRYREMTQTSLAEAAGVSQGFIADIEAGRKHGAPSTLKVIARVLRVPLDMLVQT